MLAVAEAEATRQLAALQDNPAKKYSGVPVCQDVVCPVSSVYRGTVSGQCAGIGAGQQGLSGRIWSKFYVSSALIAS